MLKVVLAQNGTSVTPSEIEFCLLGGIFRNILSSSYGEILFLKKRTLKKYIFGPHDPKLRVHAPIFYYVFFHV